MSTIKYRGAQEIRKTYEISSETLRRWNNQGKISSIRTPGGNRLYSVVDVEKIFGNQERINEKKKICYARVSSEKQKEDLDRQCEYLRQKCPDHELNWKRKVLRPFWNDRTKEISRRLWLPTRTVSAVSLLNWSNGSLVNTIQRSWYSVRTSTLMIPNPVSLPRIYYQSLLSLQQDTTDSDQLKIENDEERLKTRKIRIYPTPEEREKLRKWMGTARWTYNKVLKMVQDDGITDMSVIRRHYLNNECFTTKELLWVKETPREVRSYVSRQLMSAYKTNKKLHGNNFRMKYRSKKDRIQTISILARDWNRNRGEYAFLKDIVTSEQSLKVNNMVNITMNHLGHFYLCVSVPLDIIDNQDDVRGKVISLDPGVRTFMTGYDPDGQLIEWGNGDLNKIFKLSKKYDKLQSDKDLALGRTNKRKRFRLKKKCCELYNESVI